MRKLIVLSLLVFILTGCKAEESYETMMDGAVEPVHEKMHIMVNLPEEAAMQTMAAEDSGSVYFCKDYVLTVQTLPGGDLHKTVTETTGFTPDQLSVIATARGDTKCYDFVWTCLGENGDQVGRCAILDDGNYHYVLTAMADEEPAGRLSKEVWNGIFDSFHLIAQEDVVSSGS